MYNYSGIIYRIYAVPTPFLILGLFMLFIVFSKSSKKRRGNLILCAVLLATSILTASFYLYKSANPIIESCTGYFVEQRSDPNVAFSDVFSFDTRDDLKKLFDLDIFSKKDIFPNDFIEGEKYIIFYERDTKIIVAVEKANKN